MLIRPMTREDLPEALAITNQAFSHDELFSWIYPRNDEYPDDLRRWQMIRLRTRLVTAGEHAFVAVADKTDPFWSGKPVIVGYAFFARNGKDQASEKWKHDSLFNKFERHLLSWELWYEEQVLDRASDPARIKKLDASTPEDVYSSLGPYWHLSLLATHPEYQLRGIGAKLVKYGQQLPLMRAFR
ncbi:hypothetical protein BCR34DRAFT_605305 [Clohesyomyces aquaticus]|uniref:Acyl-CoA N-acyltransferase n=1 Tax=Clohesyomyces aquaticus TaxID=1231657 RepID=A0A1Y1YYX8_9PLEO|nr:hypothetical protein BCR34DRAFT_605305 [Clohesyomyces aquaticus]